MVNWREKRIAIVGDVMLDRYIIGKVERISPEAPVPIVDVIRETQTLGGAANSAANIATLGGTAYLFGLIGRDHVGISLLKYLENSKISHLGVLRDDTLYKNERRPTTVKTRVMSHNQQVVRFDIEKRFALPEILEKRIVEGIEGTIPDGILVSDYEKGVVTQGLMNHLKDIAHARGIPLVVDPKPGHMNMYSGVSLITPNRNAAQKMVRYELETIDDVRDAARDLSETLKTDVLITLGSEGMFYRAKGTDTGTHIPAHVVEVSDVSGAGDTVAATMILGMTANLNSIDAAQLANRAAGIKVTKSGTHPVLYDELFPG